MDGDQIIIGVDEGTAQNVPSPGPTRWPLVVLGLVAALAIGILVGSGRGPSEPTPAEIEQVAKVEAVRDQANLVANFPEVREPEVVAEPRPLGSPLRELVPGLEDVLIITLLDSESEPLYQLVWGPGASSAVRMTTLDHGVFDQAGNLFARIEHSLWNGQMLAVGDLSSLSTGPVAVGADGFAWHGAHGGRIAWTGDLEEGRRALFTGDLARIVGDGDLNVTWVADIGGAHLIAWEDWGFALDSDGELILLGPSGSDLGRGPYRLLGSASPSTVVVAEGATVLVGDPDLENLEEPWWTARIAGEVSSVHRSQTRSVLAVDVIESDGPVTYVVKDNDIVRLDLDGARVQNWSSDGRLLIFSSTTVGDSTLTFYDVDSDATVVLQLSDQVDRVFVRPG